LFDKTVSINNKNYIDAAIRIPYLIDKKIFRNHKKIIILSQRKISLSIIIYYRIIGFLFSFLGNLDKSFYKEIANKYKRYKEFEDFISDKKDKNIFFIYPSKKLGGIFDNSEKTLLRNYQQGENDVMSLKTTINAFLEKD